MHWQKVSVFKLRLSIFVFILAVLLRLSFFIAAERGIPVDKNATADKPQAKAWYQDGSWWSILDSGQEGSFIFRLEGEVWRRTAAVYQASQTHADVLSNLNDLCVLVWGGQKAHFLRYRYRDPERSYSLVPGYPVGLDLLQGSETAVLARDSRGRLWVTYESQGSVYVSYAESGLNWCEHQSIGCGLANDDISSVISWDGRLGVFWSDQNQESLHFRVRGDSHPLPEWGQIEVVAKGGLVADDHINLAEHDGLVYAVTKTSVDDAKGGVSGPTQAQIILNVRSDEGEWSMYDVAPLSSENVTRPIIVLDEENREAYVFYRNGDKIVYKRSLMAEIDFSSEPSVAIEVEGVTLNNVTSTKQNVNSTTGLLVLATGNDGRAYHRLLPIP